MLTWHDKMKKTPRHTPTGELSELVEAIVSLETAEEAERFLRDLCTVGELEAMAHRWQVAQLLDRGLHYLEISGLTGASTTTVTRVAHWLRHGEGGYRIVLERSGSPSATA